jgi:hypothetical protein
MSRTTRFQRRPERTRRAEKTRLQVELLETRNLMSSGLTLTPLVQVSDLSPLDPAHETPGVHTTNSEVEPQLAVDPRVGHSSHAVAVYQQDRYRGSAAAALVASVTTDADNPLGAHWSTPAAIPGFDSTVTGAAFQRYTDPWVSFAPNGTIYASAIGISLRGGLPSDTAVLVVTSTDGGLHWSAPTTAVRNTAEPGTDGVDLANDKEAITADPTDPTGQTAYVAWDRLNHPSDEQNFNAYHGFGFRGDALFAKTTDGGATWQTQVTFAPLANMQTIGHQIVVLPGGTLVDSFSLLNGSGNQPAKAAQNHLAVMLSTDSGITWTAPIVGPTLQPLVATNPDTGADIRTGEILADVAVDPGNGNLYMVWADARFSNFQHNDIAFSMSTDGGLTWSDPIKINQTPTNLSDANQQAFTPSVAVAANGTVAVTYYDFRNNTSTDVGASTDYWLVHADLAFTNPSSWASDEKRLTDTSFNMTIAPNSRGNFLGDYQGLSAAGNSFYALFAQAGTDASNNSNIWFRDPPPAEVTALGAPTAAALAPSGMPSSAGTLAVDAPAARAPSSAGMLAVGALAALGAGDIEAPEPKSRAAETTAAAGELPPLVESVAPVSSPAGQSANDLLSGGGGDPAEEGDAPLDAALADGLKDPPPFAG